MRLAVLLAALIVAGPAAAASFDCTKAATPAEHAICANPELSSLDDLVNRAYGEVRKGVGGTPDAGDRAKALDDMRAFAARKTRCAADIGCLLAAHAGAVADLQVLGSTVALPDTLSATEMTSAVPAETPVLPTREGACVSTHVVEIGGRLEGDTDFSSGTTVELADGLSQVSYDKVDAIVASKRGDPVLACLVSVPKHCPPGDDRGRTYTATNLRTRQSWTLPDSQHMCGGA